MTRLQLTSQRFIRTYNVLKEKCFHEHEWHYQAYQSKVRRECKCGDQEESRPEIDEIFGGGFKVWYTRVA